MAPDEKVSPSWPPQSAPVASQVPPHVVPGGSAVPWQAGYNAPYASHYPTQPLPATLDDYGRRRVAAEATLIRGWSIVLLIVAVAIAILHEIVAQRIVVMPLGWYRFQNAIHTFVAWLVVLGSMFTWRAARAIIWEERRPSEAIKSQGPYQSFVRVPGGLISWPVVMLAVGLLFASLQYAEEWMFYSPDTTVFTVAYYLSQWVPRAVAILIVVASIILIVQIGKVTRPRAVQQVGIPPAAFAPPTPSPQPGVYSPQAAPSFTTPQPSQQSPVPPQGNWIARHWRGDLRLGRSYWVNGVLIATLLNAIFAGSVAALSLGLRDRAALVLALIVLITIPPLVTLWQLVGVWRSAGKHVGRGGRKFWAVVARIVVVLNVLVGAVVILNNIAVTFSIATDDRYWLDPRVRR